MAITNNVSFLGQTQAQSRRLNDMRALLDNLQRQATTQKKADNYGGLGSDSLNVQRLRNVQLLTSTYIKNADAVAARMDIMNTSMTKMSELGATLRDAINLGGKTDIVAVKELAAQTLSFMRDLTNQQWDGRYIFAGSDSQTEPFPNLSIVSFNMKNEVNQWLAGTTTTDNMLAALNGYSGSNLGLSAGLATSGAVTARVGQNMDIDYTVKADDTSFQNLIRATAMLASLEEPDPANGDVATDADFQQALQFAVDALNAGVQDMNKAVLQLSSKYSAVGDIKKHLQTENGTFLKQIDSLENIDPSTAIIQLQLLQSQLTAAYQVTSIVNNLSMTNFM